MNPYELIRLIQDLLGDMITLSTLFCDFRLWSLKLYDMKNQHFFFMAKVKDDTRSNIQVPKFHLMINQNPMGFEWHEGEKIFIFG